MFSVRFPGLKKEVRTMGWKQKRLQERVNAQEVVRRIRRGLANQANDTLILARGTHLRDSQILNFSP